MQNRDEHLMHQAADTADYYMTTARRRIDDLFGKGYADKNPQLIGDFMKAAASDFMAMAALGRISEQLNGLAEAIDLHRVES